MDLLVSNGEFPNSKPAAFLFLFLPASSELAPFFLAVSAAQEEKNGKSIEAATALGKAMAVPQRGDGWESRRERRATASSRGE